MTCVIIEFGDSEMPRKSEKQKLSEAKEKVKEDFIDHCLLIGVES
jgi:hypothetical protein